MVAFVSVFPIDHSGSRKNESVEVFLDESTLDHKLSENRPTLQNVNAAEMHQNALKITCIWYLFGAQAILVKVRFRKNSANH